MYAPAEPAPRVGRSSRHDTIPPSPKEVDDISTRPAAPSDIERAIAQSEGLQATAAALGRALRTTEVAEIAVREGMQRLGVGRGVVGVLQPNGHTIRTVAAVGFDHDVVGGFPTFELDDTTPVSDAMRAREPMILDSTEEILARYPQYTSTTAPGGPAVVVPLLYEDRAIGGIYFRYARADAVAESDKPYLTALGRLCAAALERARLYEAEAEAWVQAHRAQERLTFLASVGETLAHAPDVDAALARITELAVPTLADWAAVFLLGPDRSIRMLSLERDDEASIAAVREFLAHRPPSLQDPVGAGAAIASGRVSLIVDYPAVLARLDVSPEARRIVEVAGVRSVMHCPLTSDDVVYGALALATIGTRSFTDADASFGEELGRRVGTVLAKARLNAELRNRLRGQEAVARLGQLAVVHHDLEPLFEAAVREISDVLDADITAIMQHQPGTHALRIVAGSGWRDGVVGSALISDNARSHSGFALVSDGPVVSNDYGEERRFRPSPLVVEHAARSGVTTPIIAPNGRWGVLGVHSRMPNHFSPDQVALLDTFANVLGSAISRRAVEISLRERDDRLELALAVSRTGFWEWDVRSGQILWSDEICRLHGLPPGTTLNGLDAYLEMVHPADRQQVRELVAEAAQSGAYDAEFRIVLPDGRTRWTNATAKVFYDEGHNVVRMVGVSRDVTDRRELEAERARIAESERRASELNQAFIGVVSHELRTPITSIFAGSKLLRRMNGGDPEKRNELTADIEAEAERLYRLTEDLLVLTRVERGTLEMGMEPVALPRVLERVIASEQERWPLTTIELVVQPGMPIALGDNTYIEQLIRNLVGNAAKYASQSGTVQVVASATQPQNGRDAEVEVRVLDRGPGLSEADSDHLFDLFYRSPLTSKKAPGAGIGLFVCNHLARAMGGRLWAHNREGGGSEFGFSLLAYDLETHGARTSGRGGSSVGAEAGAGAGGAAGSRNGTRAPGGRAGTSTGGMPRGPETRVEAAGSRATRS